MTNSIITESTKSSAPSLLYIILPLFFGICMDIGFTQLMGTQYCSFDNAAYTCNIHGIHVEQWQREIVRFTVQLSLIMCALLFIQKMSPSSIIPMYSSLLGVIGLILLFIGQVDLFSDFRRLCNGLVFSIKHN